VLGTLTATRDFTYVTDTVRGLRMLAECRKARGLEVNIGSERDIPMGGLATLVQCVMYGAASDPVLDESWARPERSEVQRLLSDSSLMNALTGWSPEVPLREAIAATAVWMEMSLDEMPTGRVM
jgi:nucleoside-diphosphate-sugar epimerase